MLSMGLRVKHKDVLASARPFRVIALSLVANFVLVPVVTVGLLALFQTNPLVSAGFLILAVCPGAPVGPPFTAIARGDVPRAVGMMLFLAGFSVFLSPALLSVLLVRLSPTSDLHIDYLAIVGVLLVTQLLPLALGLGIHHRAPRMTQAIARPVGVLGNVLLLALVVLIVVAQLETLSAIRARGWAGMVLLLLTSLGIGWVCGGPELATRKALAVTTAIRNVAVGLVIASSNFAGTPAVTAVVAYGLVSLLGALGFALLIGRLAVDEPKMVNTDGTTALPVTRPDQ